MNLNTTNLNPFKEKDDTSGSSDTSTTQPVLDVWIKEEPRDEEEDVGAQQHEEFKPFGASPDDAETKYPVPESLQKNLEDETKSDTKRKKLDPHSSQWGELESDTKEIKTEIIHVEFEMKRVGENTGHSGTGHVGYTDGDRETGSSMELPTKQNDCESTTSNSFVIVPDVRSLLGNFKQGPVKPLPPSESPSKRRLTSATKLRENMILIMQHSTIVPFRHNSNFINDYICYYCDNTYKTMKELREHTETVHVGKVDDETILSCMRTRAHKLINADISCIKCRQCNEQVSTIEALIKHLTDVHKQVYHATKNTLHGIHGILGYHLSSDEPKCHLCNNTFESFRALFSHMNEHYEAYICYCCQKKFVNLLRYRTHMKTHIIIEEKAFDCDHCNVTCKTKTGLVYHMKRYHLNVSLKCEQCPETFRFKEYRKREEHMIEAHGFKKVDLKYTCDICQNGKTYSSKNTLKIHKSNVHKVGDVPRIQCELCAFVTHHTKRMKEHMDVHNGVKNYGCDICEKKFRKPYTLRVHMRMHLNDKRYACSLCEDAYVHKSMLQYHMKKKHPDSGITI